MSTNIGFKAAAQSLLSIVPKVATTITINLASVHDASLLIYGEIFANFDGATTVEKSESRKFLLDLALS